MASVLGVWLAALLFAAPAVAGRPTPGATYYGLGAAGQYPRGEDLIPPTAELRVARSGRRLEAAEIRLFCGRGRSLDDPVVRLSLLRNPAAVVRRDGRFSFPAVGLSDRKRRVSLWLSGRFVTAQYARLFYRVRDRRGCPPTDDRYPDVPLLALYRNGKPPFSGCRSQRAATLLRTDTARVFQQVVLDEFSSFVTHVYACLYARPHRRVDLGQNYDDEQVEVPRLAGSFVAWWSGVLQVMDLRDPASVRLVDATPGFGTAYPQPASDLVLKPSGVIAWIILNRDQELWALDAAGLRKVDAGPALDPESLELNESIMTWINNGAIRTATLD